VQLLSLGVCGAAGNLHRIGAESEVLLPEAGRPSAVALKTDRGTAILRFDGWRLRAEVVEGAEPVGFGLLTSHGRWQTEPLPGAGDRRMLERRRDFARLAAPGGQQALLVVAPEASAPASWSRREGADAGDMSPGVAEAAAADLGQWLEEALGSSPPGLRSGLEDRCVALLGVSEAISFALAQNLTPALSQPHFVLFASATGEVRVAWLAFATDQIQSGPGRGTCLVRLISEDLNGLNAEESAKAGVWMDFIASAAEETDMSQLIARSTGLFRRATDSGDWQAVLRAS